MVELWVSDVLLVDLSRGVVCLEAVGGLDTAANWSVLVELGLHLGNTLDSSVGRNVVFLVVDGPALVEASLSGWAWWPGAVSADVNGLTGMVEVVGDVLLAGRVWDTMVVGILEDVDWVSTVASAASLAVNHHLGVQSDWGRGFITEHDVESVSEGRGGSLGPA